MALGAEILTDRLIWIRGAERRPLRTEPISRMGSAIWWAGKIFSIWSELPRAAVKGTYNQAWRRSMASTGARSPSGVETIMAT